MCYCFTNNPRHTLFGPRLLGGNGRSLLDQDQSKPIRAFTRAKMHELRVNAEVPPESTWDPRGETGLTH